MGKLFRFQADRKHHTKKTNKAQTIKGNQAGTLHVWFPYCISVRGGGCQWKGHKKITNTLDNPSLKENILLRCEGCRAYVKDGWPVIGVDGKVPESIEVPFAEMMTEEIIQSDSFSHTENTLEKVWQWNQARDDSAWSFMERPGYLRLKNRNMAKDLLRARDTLTQRTRAPYCGFTVNLSCEGMKDGDYAGLCVLLEQYGQIGVRQRNGRRHIVVRRRDGEKAPYELIRSDKLNALEKWYCIKENEMPLSSKSVWLRILFHYDSWGSEREKAEFFYSTDGEQFCRLGKELELFYSLLLFVGARIGIFSYNGEQENGGVSDFRDFTVM